MKKICVLGAGLVGKAIAADLCRDYELTSIDINMENLDDLREGFPIKTLQADLKIYDKIPELIKDFDLVIGAVPGFMGYKVLESVIKSGKNVIDISFFPEDPFDLDKLALEMGVVAVVDCGVAPGMGNLILGRYNKLMKIDSFECYVGGLPIVRKFPYQYKAPFSPVDVIEEYTRPARYVENSNIVVKPPMSEQEYIDFEGIGTLEAFNTDGLRTLLKTMKIPNMKEKTLRYMGHIDYIKVLKESGFFSDQPISFKGIEVKPIDFTSKILFSQWKLGKDEEEFTVMKIRITGEENGDKKEILYLLHDSFDKETGFSSMARTTGYTATAVARLVVEGEYQQKGIIPPEFIGEDESCFNSVLNYLKDRGVLYDKRIIYT